VYKLLFCTFIISLAADDRWSTHRDVGQKLTEVLAQPASSTYSSRREVNVYTKSEQMLMRRATSSA